MAMFLMFMLLFYPQIIVALEPRVIEGRKDGNSCCDKLDNNTFSNDCEETLLWAGEHEKYAYTPNFPNRFPVQKKCIWSIYTKEGKRVRLEFRDFYLIGPGDDGICHSQGVVVKSPWSSQEMGPHCGNAGLPSIVSAGNYLRVELISNIPMTTENFRGFKMSFSETVETPSPELRPLNWENSQDLVATIPPKLQPRLPITTKKPTKTSSRKPSRYRPGRRLGSLSPSNGYHPRNVYRATNYRGNNVQQPPKVFTQPPREDGSPTLSSEAIVGIAVGAMVLIGLILLVIIKLNLRMKARKANLKQGHKKSDGLTTISENVHKKPPEFSNDQTPKNDDNSSMGYYVYFYDDDGSGKKKQGIVGKSRKIPHRSKENSKANVRQQRKKTKTKREKSPDAERSHTVVTNKRRHKDNDHENEGERAHSQRRRKKKLQSKVKKPKEASEDNPSAKKKSGRSETELKQKTRRTRHERTDRSTNDRSTKRKPKRSKQTR